MSRIKRILQQHLATYKFVRKFYRSHFGPRRIVPLSQNTLHKTRLKDIRNDSRYNDVISDLIAYTGFPIAKLEPYLLRYPEKHFESEFNWFQPKDKLELTWFYRCSSAYLFANSVHPYASALDVIKQGKALDYGAGVGCNTVGLAKRGVDVHFLEISRIQADFIRFRANRHGLENVTEVFPYHRGVFDPISCIKGKYDAIVAMDVLEHIPDYHVVVQHFIDALNPGGMIIENSPFDLLADDIAIHLRPSVPLKDAMTGMERIKQGIWQKKT